MYTDLIFDQGFQYIKALKYIKFKTKFMNDWIVFIKTLN